MKVQSLLGNRQLLDGGSMFGNCPRTVWEKWAIPDAQHRIPLCCRCLLIQEDSGLNILFESGIGSFFSPKMRERYGVVETNHVLLESIEARGLQADDIDVIVLSHLHFDHAGGLLMPWRDDEQLRLAFGNARFITSRRAWERALEPHPRDRASFIPGLCELLDATGRVELIEEEGTSSLGSNYSFVFSDGHTPGLTLTRIETPWGGVTFQGDLIPGVAWVHLPITMGYDRFPERVIDEKHEMLDRLVESEEWAFFTHDPDIAVAKIEKDERGRYRATSLKDNIDWSDD